MHLGLEVAEHQAGVEAIVDTDEAAVVIQAVAAVVVDGRRWHIFIIGGSGILLEACLQGGEEDEGTVTEDVSLTHGDTKLLAHGDGAHQGVVEILADLAVRGDLGLYLVETVLALAVDITRDLPDAHAALVEDHLAGGDAEVEVILHLGVAGRRIAVDALILLPAYPYHDDFAIDRRVEEMSACHVGQRSSAEDEEGLLLGTLARLVDDETCAFAGDGCGGGCQRLFSA